MHVVRSEDRVRKGAERLQKFLSAKQQGRLDGFFTVKPKEPGSSPTKGKGKEKGGEGGAKKGVKRKAGVSGFFLVYCNADG